MGRSAKMAMPIVLAVVCTLLTGILISAMITLSGVNPNGQKNADPLWQFVLGLHAETKGGYSGELATEVFAVKDISKRHTLEREIIRKHLAAGSALFTQLAEKTSLFWGNNSGIHLVFNNQTERTIPIINKPIKELFLTINQTERCYYAAIVGIGIVSLALLFFDKREMSMMLILIGLVVAIFFVVYIFIEVQSRYRYFVTPFITVLAGGSINKLWHVRKNAPATTCQASNSG